MKVSLLLLCIFCCQRIRSQDQLDDISLDNDADFGEASDGASNTHLTNTAYKDTDEEKKEVVMKTVASALKQPEGRNRLSQVLPIVRLMSPPQRLALATLVMAQVIASPANTTTKMPVIDMKSNTNLTSQLMLPISMDIANMFRNLAADQPQGRSSHGYISELYQGGHRVRTATGPNIRRPPPTLNGINRRNVNGNVDKISKPPKRRPVWSPSSVPSSSSSGPASCTVFANNLCLEIKDYPEESIMNSMKSQKPDTFKALKSEPSLEYESELESKTLERRQGDIVASTKKPMCTSSVEYARPKKARSTSGQWKYIVNTGDYSQTLRMEICSKPENSCNFLAEDINSQCVQVYNYHRLLTWDDIAGLTMDVFKVPTCCSCRVLGYGGVPFPQTTPETSTLPNGLGFEHPDTNLVGNDDINPPIRVPSAPTKAPPKGIRVRPFPPKRDTGRRPPGTILHKGPPLPLENEGPQSGDYKFPPYDSTLRRYTRNNTLERMKSKHPGLKPLPVTPNQRHPAIPVDSLNSDTMSINSFLPTALPPPSTAVTTQSSVKRINYSYHPIIDYFRPQAQIQQQQQAESRVGIDWTPIVSG